MFRKQISNFISLDLGTVNTLVYIKGHGVIYNEPTIVAYNQKTKKIIAFGKDAFRLVGKTHSDISLITPLVSGVVSDIYFAKEYIKHVFSRLSNMKVWKNATVLLACPSSVTLLEKKILIDIAVSFGAVHVFVEEEVKMSALGVGLDIEDPVGNLVVDIGGGTTDIAVISAGNVVASRSSRIAGNFLNKEVIKKVRMQHNLVIGLRTAEEVKIAVGSLIHPTTENEKSVFITAFGRDVISGLPREVKIYTADLVDIFERNFRSIAADIVVILEDISSELSGDVLHYGAYLAGGGALTKGLDKWMENELGIVFKVGENPLMSVINGTKLYERKIIERVFELERHGKK